MTEHPMSTLSQVVTAYTSKLRLFNRDVRLFLLTSALAGFTVLGGILPVLLNLYLLRLGYGPEFIGQINGMGQFAFSLFCLFAGVIGTRWSSRRIMIGGMGLVVGGFGSLPLAEFTPPPLQVGWLLVAYMLGWLGTALYVVNGIPFLMRATGLRERTHAFSMRTALGPLAGFAGSLIGGLLPGLFARAWGLSLDQPAPFRYPLWIAALLFIPAPLVMLSTREVRTEMARARYRVLVPQYQGQTFPYRLIALIALVGLFRCAGQGVAKIFFNVYLDAALRVSTATIGALMAVGQLAAVPAVLTMPPVRCDGLPLLVARWGKERTIVLSSLGMAAGLIPLALIPHWSAAGLGFIVVSALFSIASTTFTVYSQEIVPPNWRAAMAGATNMAAGLSRAAAAIGGGYVITALGYRALFLAGAALTTVGVLIFWTCFSGVLCNHA